MATMVCWVAYHVDLSHTYVVLGQCLDCAGVNMVGSREFGDMFIYRLVISSTDIGVSY